ncbi:MAG: aldo/keto reductase [Deltaproteobacteria bacterium]|nr:aldo/keto reductase [Deltaproteobacteria bacterium]
MRTRVLGRTGIEVSEIGLGCWGLSGESYGAVSEQDARATLDSAFAEGCTLVELASCYGPTGHELDRTVGEAVREFGAEKLRVVLRVGVDRAMTPPQKRFDRSFLMRSVEQSLERMKLDSVAVVLLHNPLSSTLERSFDALDTLASMRERGLALAMGVSAGSVQTARVALKQSVDVISLPYNVLFPRMVHALTPELVRMGVGVLAHATLGYGVLAGTWHADREFDKRDHRASRWEPEDLARRMRQREVLRPFVQGAVLDMREAAVRYVLSNPNVHCALVGARNAEMAKQNAHAADELPYLDPAMFSTLGARLEEEGIMT